MDSEKCDENETDRLTAPSMEYCCLEFQLAMLCSMIFSSPFPQAFPVSPHRLHILFTEDA